MPRVTSNGPRRKRKAKSPDEFEQQQRQEDNAQSSQNDSVLGQLLTKFPDFDPTWPDEIKTKWFAGFEQFMQKAATK